VEPLGQSLDIDLQADPVDPAGAAPLPPRSGWQEFLRSWVPAILAVLVIRSVLVEPFQIPSGSMVPTLAIGDFILVSKLNYGLRVPFTGIEVLDLGEPKRGDVVVFSHPPSQSKDPWCTVKRIPTMLTFGYVEGPRECSVDYIKRIVGLPGDTIEVHDSVLHVNGEPMVRSPDGSVPYTDGDCQTREHQQFNEDLEGVEHPVLQSVAYLNRVQDYGPLVVPADSYFMMGDNRDNSSDSRFWGVVPRDYIRGKALFVWFSIDGCTGNVPGIGSIRWSRLGEAVK
jgi:signal peptidase I